MSSSLTVSRQHLVADYAADPEFATQYELAMRGSFPGLRVTNEPAGKLDAQLS